MAGTKTSEIEVRVEVKNVTECCLCSETYKDPKMLPCIHTFCRKCLEEAGSKTSKCSGDQMPCPMCRKEFTIPEEGYAALQKNVFMGKLIEMAKIESLSGGTGLCEACMEEKSDSTSVSEVPLADMYCNDCEQKLCEECSRHHRKNKLTRNHQLVAAVDSQSKVKIVRSSNCEKHEREHMLYCSECKELLCKSCFGEGHQNHRLQDVRTAVEDFESKIRDSLSSLEVCESEVLEKKEVLNFEVEEYFENLERLKLEVLAQRDATIKLVTEHADIIMQEIGQLKIQKRSEVQAEIEDTNRYLTCLKSLIIYCAEVMTKGSARDIFCVVDMLKARAEEIKEQLESETEIKTYLRKMSFHMVDLEDSLNTENCNIIGTIQECQTEGEEEDETSSDNSSHDGDIEMEDNCRMPISGSNGLLAEINHLKEELENARCRICGLEMEKKAFEKRINELELELGIKRQRKSTSGLPMTQASQPLYKQLPPPRISIDYKRSPNLVKTLCIQGGDRSHKEGTIFGFTVLDDELFLGCFADCIFGRSAVEVYDIKTFNFKRRWQVRYLSPSNTGFAHISCMASCTRHKYLYACVSTVGGFVRCDPVIQRTDVNGSNVKEWKIDGSTPVSDLSVTGEGNIIVITGNNLLNEYSRDGVLVYEMKLPSSLGIAHPLHALKLPSGNFVVSHGLGKDRLHRVLMLSKRGQIIKSFGEMPASGVCFSKVQQVPQVCGPKLLNEPVYLTVDGFGNILVADRGYCRIVVLNSNLDLVSYINPTQPLQRPRCMSVDDGNKLLFVCENLKKISVFDFSV